MGCWFSGSLLDLFAQLVIGWGSLRQARWRGLPSGQLDTHILHITYYIFNIHTPWNPITHSYTMGSLGIVLIEYLWNQQIQYCSACRVGVGHTAAAGASCGWRVPRSGCVLHSGLANAAGRHIGHSCPGGGGVGPPPNICSWCM